PEALEHEGDQGGRAIGPQGGHGGGPAGREAAPRLVRIQAHRSWWSVELQLGQHVLAVEANEIGLVANHVVDVDLVESGVDEALDVGRVVVRAVAYQDPIGEALRAHRL